MTTDRSHGLGELTWFAETVIRELGDEALSFYGKGKTHLKFDDELVTQAEVHLVDRFEKKIALQFPSHQVYRNNKKMDDYRTGEQTFLWVFDAIDGVANFQAGIPLWGISLSIIENFWPVFGAFYMPATGDFFHAVGGSKAYLGQKEIHISEQESINNESLLLTYSRFHQNFNSNFPGKIRNLGCTAAHICYVAMGSAEAAVVANESYQNLAAVQIIIESAGGKIYPMDGSEFYLNDHLSEGRIEKPLLIVSPDNRAEVLDYIREIF
ncbi:MAG: inositol monophosphatase family protein [Thermodesulfobacteriota bacterium]